MKSVIERAYAKINIGLSITGKRDDGYHLLSMVMQTVGLYDSIGIYRTNDRYEISMDMDYAGSHPEEEITCDESNLCIRAAKLICSLLPESHGYYIHLTKNIPVAAGMAGGSSDAAAVLRGINAIEGHIFSSDQLRAMSVSLGADVPYCIDGGLCLCEGIGEKITPIDASLKTHILLAKPPCGVSTPAAYKWFDCHPDSAGGDINAVIDSIRKGDMKGIRDNIHNDLEDAARHLVPSIPDIEEIMEEKGAILSRVTGSGPTVFGFFSSEEDRSAASSEIKSKGLCTDIFSVEALTPDYAHEAERK